MNNQLDNNTATGEEITPTVDNGNPIPQEAGKTFTQEQVNAFVQDRLTRERAKHEADRADLETRATTAERSLTMHRFGIPEDEAEKYLKLATLYPNEAGDFAQSLAMAVKEFPPPKPKVPRIVAPSHGSNLPARDPIREGMGLNRKE